MSFTIKQFCLGRGGGGQKRVTCKAKLKPSNLIGAEFLHKNPKKKKKKEGGMKDTDQVTSTRLFQGSEWS